MANRLLARPAMRMILPTGETPLGMYAELRRIEDGRGLRAGEATLFQLDEYRGLPAGDPRTFRSYLRRELSGVRLGRVHALDSAAPDPDAECARHQALLEAGRIDLAVLGLGRDGHVAFDEPGSPLEAGVRRVALHETTRADAAGGFGGLDRVPREAITVGLEILGAARELVLLVTGGAKADALHAMLEAPAGRHRPASLLRDHPRLTILCDRDAASRLEPEAAWTSDRAVVVLGHRERGSAEDRISDESRARLALAEDACRADPPRLVVLTGYTRTAAGDSEAEQMNDAWSLAGVPALMEIAGRNTAENAARSLPLIEAAGSLRRVTVVSSAWHIRVPYFFAPYRARGFELSFARERGGPTLGPLAAELAALPAMPRQRRAALDGMRRREAATRRP